jgi:hypothetical protein
MTPKGDPKGGRPYKDPAGPSKMQSYRLPPATIAAIDRAVSLMPPRSTKADAIARGIDLLLQELGDDAASTHPAEE